MVMKYPFILSYFPDSKFEVEISFWTGKAKLWKDGELFERSSDQGKPFLIPNESGEVFKIYTKLSWPDFVPSLEINGTKHTIVEKLAWYQYAVASLPLILIFIGGAIGGAVGAGAAIFNLQALRSASPAYINYLKVIGITVLAFILYYIVAYLFFVLISSK